jgi:hypothetical protein
MKENLLGRFITRFVRFVRTIYLSPVFKPSLNLFIFHFSLFIFHSPCLPISLSPCPIKFRAIRAVPRPSNRPSSLSLSPRLHFSLSKTISLSPCLKSVPQPLHFSLFIFHSPCLPISLSPCPKPSPFLLVQNRLPVSNPSLNLFIFHFSLFIFHSPCLPISLSPCPESVPQPQPQPQPPSPYPPVDY